MTQLRIKPSLLALQANTLAQRLGATRWSDLSGNSSHHFDPPLGRGARTAPPQRGVGAWCRNTTIMTNILTTWRWWMRCNHITL